MKTQTSDNQDGTDASKKRKRSENAIVPVRSSRVKKSVERFQPTPATAEKPPIEIPKGSGEPLGEIKAVADELERRKVDDDLKSLHRILFGRSTDPGGPRKIKQNLRLFHGLDLKDEKEEEAIKDKLGRYMQTGLKDLCDLFNIEKSGDKSAIIDRIVDFLKNPRDTGHVKRGEIKKAKLAEKRKKKAERAAKKAAKASKKSKSKKSAKSSDDDEEDDDEEGEMEVDEEEKENDEEDELAEDEEEEEPKKLPVKKQKPKKSEPKPSKSTTKKPTKKSSKISKSKVTESDEDREEEAAAGDTEPMDEDEEDVELESIPSDADIVAQIQKIFKDAADIKSITAKTVRGRLNEHFKSDLSSKKKFIKDTINEQYQKFSESK